MLMGCITYLRARFGSKKGQGMVEYGLIVGILAIILLAALTFLKTPIKDLFSDIGSVINGNAPSPTATMGT